MRPRRGETGRSRAYRLPCLGTRERDLDVRYNEGGTLDECDDDDDDGGRRRYGVRAAMGGENEEGQSRVKRLEGAKKERRWRGDEAATVGRWPPASRR